MHCVISNIWLFCLEYVCLLIVIRNKFVVKHSEFTRQILKMVAAKKDNDTNKTNVFMVFFPNYSHYWGHASCLLYHYKSLQERSLIAYSELYQLWKFQWKCIYIYICMYHTFKSNLLRGPIHIFLDRLSRPKLLTSNKPCVLCALLNDKLYTCPDTGDRGSRNRP